MKRLGYKKLAIMYGITTRWYHNKNHIKNLISTKMNNSLSCIRSIGDIELFMDTNFKGVKWAYDSYLVSLGVDQLSLVIYVDKKYVDRVYDEIRPLVPFMWLSNFKVKELK